MKHLTIEHIERLDALKEEAFLEECVENLIEIAYPNAYPDNKDKYPKFVKEVFEVCKEHNLSNQKHAFSLMLLWHMVGEKLLEDEEFVAVLKHPTVSTHKKADYFDAYIDEILEKEEEQ
jgi:hypothetical protein